MKIRTTVKADGIDTSPRSGGSSNHNETLLSRLAIRSNACAVVRGMADEGLRTGVPLTPGRL